MNRRSTLATVTASLLLVSLALPAGDAAAQGAKSLVGTWTIVSDDTIDASGNRTPIFGPNPRGLLIFTANARYSVIFARAEGRRKQPRKGHGGGKQGGRRGQPLAFR